MRRTECACRTTTGGATNGTPRSRRWGSAPTHGSSDSGSILGRSPPFSTDRCMSSPASSLIDAAGHASVISTNVPLARRFATLLSWIAALAAFGSVWYVWGSLHQLPRYHDEAAYLLQAQIFAAGKWTAPAPPIPEFFEQAHTLVTPVRAAKYPPGTALTF